MRFIPQGCRGKQISSSRRCLCWIKWPIVRISCRPALFAHSWSRCGWNVHCLRGNCCTTWRIPGFLGFSGISNKANLDGNTITSHEEVLAAGQLIVPKLETANSRRFAFNLAGGMIPILQFFIRLCNSNLFTPNNWADFCIRSLVRARQEMGESLYGLEKATAHQHTSQALAAISLILFLAIAELVLTVFLAPNIPAFSLLITPTMNPLITPTSTISPELLATIGVTTPLSSPNRSNNWVYPWSNYDHFSKTR